MDPFELLPPVIGLVLLLSALVIAIVLARRFRRGRDEDGSALDLLRDFRALESEGEISAEEMKKIRGILGRRVLKEFEARSAEEPPTTDPAADARRLDQ